MSKILFYVEPHPIRDSMTHFSDVLDNVSSLFLHPNGNTVKVFSNIQTLDKIADKGFIPPDWLLPPSKKQQDFFESQLVDWTTEGIDRWVQLLTGGEICDKYIKILELLYSTYQFEYIFFWGTNYSVKKFAKLNNIKQVSLELGCSRHPFENTLVADPEGVNGNSFLCNVSVEDLPESSSYNWLTEMILRNQIIYQDGFKYSVSEEIIKASKRKTVFIPLQLFDDANLLVFSPFSSLKEFLAACLPKLLDEGFFCIIKEHPDSKFRHGAYESNQEAKLYALSLSLSDIMWIDCFENSISNCLLYSISDLVVTNNSSSGFEALLYKLPVVILGDAVYKLKHIFPTLEEAVKLKYDLHNYQKNIEKLLTFFFNHYLIPSESGKNSLALIEYLKKIGDMSTINTSDNRMFLDYYCQVDAADI